VPALTDALSTSGMWLGEMPPRADGNPECRLICGDASDVLATLPDRSVHACVTSPPYWGLRDYGVPPRVWDGDPNCRHRWEPADRGESCLRCRAWRGCLGLEPTPDQFVENLIAVLREVHRVLRDDGTLWLNLGDSFAASRTYQVPNNIGRDSGTSVGSRVPPKLKPKDLIGIPWRVALALQEDGWWLRSDIVWEKPNAMPESVFDRPTRSHEFVFLLSKSRHYFYDAQAVREPDREGRTGNGSGRSQGIDHKGSANLSDKDWVVGGGRNRRSVWTVATQCFKGAHFATFPEGLVEPCILAGTSLTACGICGAPWRRVVSSKRFIEGGQKLPSGSQAAEDGLRTGRVSSPSWSSSGKAQSRCETIGWEPTCDHADSGSRCTVLDPFAGMATTGIVAARHGRNFIGIELSDSYTQMARARMDDKAQEAGGEKAQMNALRAAGARKATLRATRPATLRAASIACPIDHRAHWSSDSADPDSLSSLRHPQVKS
jgi:DNA modification methylase